jgi:hypothetical protein
MAKAATLAPSGCAEALRRLQAGHWTEWSGLPSGCTFAEIEQGFGGSSVLDMVAHLGAEAIACTRSALNDAPVLVWHAGDEPLLVEFDMLSAPQPAPDFDPRDTHRLDAVFGVSTIAAGEAVMPARGLSLIVTTGNRVVACRAFAPMSIDLYVATRLPPVERVRPLRPAHPGATP